MFIEHFSPVLFVRVLCKKLKTAAAAHRGKDKRFMIIGNYLERQQLKKLNVCEGVKKNKFN